MKKVVITGADRGLGYSLCEEFLKRNYIVYAGQFMSEWKQLMMLQEKWKEQLILIPLNVADCASVHHAAKLIAQSTDIIDCVVNNAGIITLEQDIREKVNDRGNVNCFHVNSLGPLLVTKSLLPLMEGGEKRLCFVSSEAGSVGVAHRKDLFGYCMSKTALNMGIRLLHNELYEKGFTFRIYHPGWMKTYMLADEKANGEIEAEESALVAIKQFLGHQSCEKVLMIQDVEGRIWPF